PQYTSAGGHSVHVSPQVLPEQGSYSGHAANSQLGGTRETVLPSGQLRASASQAISSLGQGANSQSGACLDTELPSAQSLASAGHAISSSGHGANSQFGPVRPTDDPSGQTFASNPTEPSRPSALTALPAPWITKSGWTSAADTSSCARSANHALTGRRARAPAVKLVHSDRAE